MEPRQNNGAGIDMAIALSIATAWMYLLGVSYRGAFFSTLGLRGQTLVAGFEDTLIAGLFALLGASANMVVFLALGIEIVVMLALLYGMVRSIRTVSRRLDARQRLHRLAKAKRRADGKPKVSTKHVDRALGAAWRVVAPPLGFLLLFALLLGSGLLAEYQGKRAAMDLVQVSKSFPADEHVLVFDGGRAVNLGPSVGCDETRCLYMARDRAVFIDRDLIAAETGISPDVGN